MGGKKKGKKKGDEKPAEPPKLIIPDFTPKDLQPLPLSVKVRHYKDLFIIYTDEYHKSIEIKEKLSKIVNVPVENMRPQPAADSAGVNRAAYRAVGLDKSDEPYWADIRNFRALALTLPEPAVYVPVPKVDADSISADCDMLIEEIGNSVPDFEPVDDSVVVEKIPEDEIFKLKLRTLDEQK